MEIKWTPQYSKYMHFFVAAWNPTETMKSFFKDRVTPKQTFQLPSDNMHQQALRQIQKSEFADHSILEMSRTKCALHLSLLAHWKQFSTLKNTTATIIWHWGRGLKKRLSLLQRASNMIWPRHDPIWHTDESALNREDTNFQLCCVFNSNTAFQVWD